MANVKFRGIMPALVTPLNEDGTVREHAVKPLVDHLLASGCSGFYICGATGEGPVLQPEARMRMAELTVEAVNGRGAVIDHIGAVDLITSKKLAAHAAKTGVDAVSSVPPFFYPYGNDQIYDYYSALSDAAGIPMLMYASPLSGVPVGKDMVARLMTIPNMIGLKWTNPNYYEMHRICELCGGDINVINGPDETLVCGLTMGAQGGIGSTYNVMPKVIVSIYDAFLRGDWEAARQAQYKANRLIELLIATHVMSGCKLILNDLGFDVGECTYPMKRFTENEKDYLRRELKALRFEEEYL